MSVRPIDLIPAIRSAPQAARPDANEEIKRLRSLPYDTYLQTRWWVSRRNRALRLAGYRCQRCGGKRELQVHHLSYDRLGAEHDADLEVLCRGCHSGEHYNRVQDHVRLYTRILSDILGGRELTDVAEVSEEAKTRCARLGIPFHHEQFHAALARVTSRIPFSPPPRRAELYGATDPHAPLTRAEAAGVLARLRASGLMKHMPEVHPRTIRQQDCRNALAIVAQAIVEQAQKCDALEGEEPESSR